MIYVIPCPPNTKFVKTDYSFLKPAKLRIRNTNGDYSLIGYGIGETISVLEPNIQYLVASSELLNEIPLTDGGFITEWPDDLCIFRI